MTAFFLLINEGVPQISAEEGQYYSSRLLRADLPLPHTQNTSVATPSPDHRSGWSSSSFYKIL